MIYLDSAATTFQKPPSVAAAMAEAMATMSSPGRGGHPRGAPSRARGTGIPKPPTGGQPHVVT